MRILHTSDWHVGRVFHGMSLLDDQRYCLEQLLKIAVEYEADVVCVAGDLYDRAVPPPDGVALLDEVVTKLVDERGIPVVIIAGNHDSPLRLDFGSKIFSHRGLTIVGAFQGTVPSVTFSDHFGPLTIYAMPYVESGTLRALDISCPHRSVLLAHAFVVGGVVCDSERPLSVGGADAVDGELFSSFDYVALGHLHRPQQVESGSCTVIRYSGSLCKYSFSETDHDKGVTIIDIDGAGCCSYEHVPLVPFHDVRIVEGLFVNLLGGEKSDDYLLVRLKDREPIFDAVGQLRTVFPNLLALERPEYSVRDAPSAPSNYRTVGDVELFGSFFRQVTGEEFTDAHAQYYQAFLGELRSEEREEAV